MDAPPSDIGFYPAWNVFNGPGGTQVVLVTYSGPADRIWADHNLKPWKVDIIDHRSLG